MSLYTVTSGNTIQAQDVNQIIDVLQQPSSGQEKGHYFVAGTTTANNLLFSGYVASLSRNATPVSVTLDTSDHSPQNCNAPSYNYLTQGGFQVYTRSTASSGDVNVGGNYTIQY